MACQRAILPCNIPLSPPQAEGSCTVWKGRAYKRRVWKGSYIRLRLP